MEPNQSYNLLRGKGNHKQNENVAFGKERVLFPLVRQNQGIEN